MALRLATHLAVVGAAALVLCIPSFGLPLPDSCTTTGATASAAPSPSCSSDLRECLRSAARETIYGARYVPAEDVARCVDAYNACISGGASKGGTGSTPASTTQRPGGKGALPQRFSINAQYEAYDCSATGTAVTCTVSAHSSTASADSWKATVTGTVSGLSVSGTMTIDQRMEANGCVMEDHGTGPFSAVFDSGGGVALREGPFQWQRKPVSCANSDPWTQPGYDATGTWAPQ